MAVTDQGNKLIRGNNGEVPIVAVVGIGDGGINGSLPAGTDRSTTITTGGTAQVLAAANTSRQSLIVQNISTGNLGINEGGTAAIGSAGTFTLPPNASYAASTNKAISIIGATTGQAFSAIEI